LPVEQGRSIIDGVDCGKIFNPLTAALLVTSGFVVAIRRGRIAR
jgi:hypothetical protein